jgi:hypothetical protein
MHDVAERRGPDDQRATHRMRLIGVAASDATGALMMAVGG